MKPHDERTPSDPSGKPPGTNRGASSDPGRRAEHAETTSGGASDAAADLGAPTIANEPAHSETPTVARPFQPSVAQVIAGRFLVRRVLGEGGMGRVYAVQDKQIEGRDVALKVLLPRYSKNDQFKKLFFQEVKSAQKFVSEYVCQVRDTGETEDGSLFLTMDLVDGEALRALLDRDKVLGPRQSLEITRQVLLGLQSGHEKGFVHRDIKPSNVMLVARIPKTDTNPYGVGARLLDFGIAGLAAEIGERSRAGTVMYMSPEQANGERLDPRSDLFAVGVLLFEMLSGRRPFEGATTHALVQSVIQTNINDRLDEIPNLQKPVRRILERALQKDREKRFQSAGEFAAAIVKSSAYRLPKEVPGWAYAGLAVLGVAAIGEAVVLRNQAQENADLNKEVAGIALQVQNAERAITERKDKEVAQLNASLEGRQKQIDALTTQVTGLTTDLEARGQEVSAKETAHSETRALLATATSNLEQAQRDAADAAKQKDDKIAELREQIRVANETIAARDLELQGLRDANATTARESTDVVKFARLYDSIAKLLAKDDVRAAQVQLEEGAKNGLFSKSGADGTDVVAGLVRGAALYHSFLASREPKELTSASRELAVAEKALGSFAVQAAAWIGETYPQAPTVERENEVRQLIVALRRKVDDAVAAMAKDDNAEYAGLDLSALAANPAPIFDHADRYVCRAHFSECAKRFVAALREQVSPADALDLDKLRTFARLGEWVARLDQDQFAFDDPELAADLRRFEFALRWYDADPGNDEMDWSSAAPAAPAGRTSDWRQVLQLQSRLAKPTSNFPIRAGRALLYRNVDDKGVESWWRERSTDPAERLRIESQSFDELGIPTQTETVREYEIEAGVLRLKGNANTLLDLHRSAGDFSVEVLADLGPEPRVPTSLVPPAEMVRFRKSLTAPIVCLVLRETGRERWISSEFGVVKDLRDGIWHRELVYASGAP